MVDRDPDRHHQPGAPAATIKPDEDLAENAEDSAQDGRDQEALREISDARSAAGGDEQGDMGPAEQRRCEPSYWVPAPGSAAAVFVCLLLHVAECNRAATRILALDQGPFVPRPDPYPARSDDCHDVAGDTTDAADRHGSDPADDDECY